jgi:hypothetical protein
MSLHRLGGAFCACVLVLGLGSMAKAQFGGGFGYGGGFGFGGLGFANGAYTLDPPPYFSLFPPVYYSHITPRPYGFSPMAYPGFYPTPERIRMPSTPYVPNTRRQVFQQSPAPQTAAKPVIIKNPFVLAEEDRPERLADGRPLPQVVTTAVASASNATRIDLDR